MKSPSPNVSPAFFSHPLRLLKSCYCPSLRRRRMGIHTKTTPKRVGIVLKRPWPIFNGSVSIARSYSSTGQRPRLPFQAGPLQTKITFTLTCQDERRWREKKNDTTPSLSTTSEQKAEEEIPSTHMHSCISHTGLFEFAARKKKIVVLTAVFFPSVSPLFNRQERKGEQAHSILMCFRSNAF